MKNIVHIITASLFVGLLGLFACETPKTDDGLTELREGFQNPPVKARAKVYWWWLNGYVDSVRLKTELRAIKDAGLGGVDIFEIGLRRASDEKGIIPAGPPFMGEESLHLIKMALDEAKKLDLEVGLGVASSWNAGGTWVEPKHASKTLYASKTLLTGGKEVKMKLPFPEITPDRNGQPRKIDYLPGGRPVYSEEIAVVAVPKGAKNLGDTSRIFDLSAQFDAATELLSWDAPEGEWDIYRYICSNSGERLIVPSPNSDGPIIDHFDSAATRMHMMYFINKLKPLVGDFKQSALKNLYLASYEAKEFAWTPTLPEMFKKLHGYEINKFIPAIYDEQLYEEKVNDDFQFDFRKTFSELMIQNHYAKSKEICNAHGLEIISESGGPGHMHHIPVETLKALGALDVPRGEFWYNREYYKEDSVVDYIWLVKEIAAASHIYQRNIVEEEAFTSYWDWQESPKDLKIIADRAFCEGMNRLVIHGFTHNPSEFGYPGIVYLAGTHYNDKRVWWPMAKAFNDYLARNSYILQQAKFVADVLYYYGDDVPNLVPPKNTRFTAGPGYDYEVINTDKLNELIVENGEVVLPGVGRYKVLALGNNTEMSPVALTKMRDLAASGAVIVGGKPTRANGLARQPEATQQIVSGSDDLWTDGTESGKIRSSQSPEEALRGLGLVPDFSYPEQASGKLDFIHYAKGDADFYLIRNTTDSWVSEKLSFRQKNRAPELWDPKTGEMMPIPIFEEKGNTTLLPLSIAPYGSYFVVFTNQPAKPKGSIENTDIVYTPHGFYSRSAGGQAKAAAIEGEWDVSFSEEWGAPAKAVFPDLTSWTQSEVDGIRYYSGIGTYNKTFEFAGSVGEGDRVYLDLGDLAEMAEVTLNDQPVGIVWTKPYRLDVTDMIKEGTNTLSVRVANTWSNRLTGDAITGEQFTNTNITNANKNLTPWKDVPLKKSGLLGPVQLEIVKLLK
ncbi:MAG: glycosyl hydrolase [Imperialibacter sp.]|uniref:glycosyl hydrolase n=1 Tax=Imperialibacter sp. TaxID=2038411 RepID=UPI003A85C1B9